MRRVLFLLLHLLLLLTSTHSTTRRALAAITEEVGVESVMRRVGSRPPSCRGMCLSCGRCEAVQVPISPQDLDKKRSPGRSNGRIQGRTALLPSSYDDHSNYKPLSWRCKCLLGP